MVHGNSFSNYTEGGGQNFLIFISCRYLVELGPRQLGLPVAEHCKPLLRTPLFPLKASTRHLPGALLRTCCKIPFIGTEKTMTAKDVTGFPTFFWAAADGGVTNGGLRGVWPPFLEIGQNRPFSPFFCLFRPFPEGAKSTCEIEKTEEKGLFPQISSDSLKPPSLKPPVMRHSNFFSARKSGNFLHVLGAISN